MFDKQEGESMNEYAVAILKAYPRLERAEEKLQARIERLASSMSGETVWVIDRILALIETKRQLIDIAEAYRRLSSSMTESELTVLKDKVGGMQEESISDELGVCRNTVRAMIERAAKKCENVVFAMKKSGLDPDEFKEALCLYGELKP